VSSRSVQPQPPWRLLKTRFVGFLTLCQSVQWIPCCYSTFSCFPKPSSCTVFLRWQTLPTASGFPFLTAYLGIFAGDGSRFFWCVLAITTQPQDFPVSSLQLIAVRHTGAFTHNSAHRIALVSTAYLLVIRGTLANTLLSGRSFSQEHGGFHLGPGHRGALFCGRFSAGSPARSSTATVHSVFIGYAHALHCPGNGALPHWTLSLILISRRCRE